MSRAAVTAPPDRKAPKPDQYEEILAVLTQRITAGEYDQGEFLPSTRRLMQQWDASRAMITKVLAALRVRGLTEVVSGRGTIVKAQEGAPPPLPVRNITITLLESDAELVRELARKARVPMREYMAQAVRDRARTEFFEAAADAERDHPPTEEDKRNDAERIAAINAGDPSEEASGVA